MSLDVVFLDVFLSKIFLSLETFLKKTTTLNIFDELMFNYKIKVGSVEECSPQFISFVVDLCNDLQQVLKENVVSEIKKSESTEKTETTLCLLEPVDPGFEVVTTTSLTSEIECGDGGHWEQSNSADTEPVDVVDMAVPETSFVAPRNKISEIYTCKYCNRKYRTKKKFFKHDCKSVPVPPEPGDKEYVEDPERGDISQACGSDGSSPLPVFFCTVCLSAYSRKELFDQHSHLDNVQEADLLRDVRRLQSQRKYVCGVCSEVYRSLARIVYHVGRCRAGPYHCELCDTVVATKSLLNRHKKKQHKGVECFFCAECGLGFKLRTSLQKHQVNRHESEQNNFPCDADNCGLLFHKKIHLTNHKIEVHGIEGKFLCQVCGHKFMNQDSLSSHLEFHNDKKKFQCGFCDKLFKSKEKMTLHVRTHTGEKPFVCNQPNCSKSFVSKSKLVEHLQRHNGERRHMCTLCSKKYANKHDLRTHTRKAHPTGNANQASKTPATESLISSEDSCFESSSEVTNMSLYSPQVILQVENPSSHVYNNVQFYPDLVRTVTVPQNVVLTSYETIIGI